MKPPHSRSPNEGTQPRESQSQDAARLRAKKPAAAWETRQPAQVTKADVEQAAANPALVRPPGQMGDSQGAAS